MARKVEVADMMACREKRAAMQWDMIRRLGCPVLSFCMNIPGPVKTDPEILAAFREGRSAVCDMLERNSIKILETHEIHEATGDELMLALGSEAGRIKTLMCEIEETNPLGRLFDLDVIGTDGMKLSRGTARTCLICGKPAQECGRARTHTADELFAAVKKLIDAVI